FIRTKIKNLNNGRVNKFTFFKGTKIKKIEIVTKKYIFLYRKNKLFYFINKKKFNQIYLDNIFIGHYRYFLKSNENVLISFIKGRNIPLFLEIKKYVTLKVIKSNLEIKGDSVNRKFKKCKIETGLYIHTPLFINVGDIVKVNTKTCKYIERIKKK
ncbi:MAG: elongation factor P, partial [Candidatus Shikimatogenerans sp. JK-2022]|nr:elongation factor P [Candidatus Shikimatogenerans bostrichidophilus]